jgi:signal transduction histidine kinase
MPVESFSMHRCYAQWRSLPSGGEDEAADTVWLEVTDTGHGLIRKPCKEVTFLPPRRTAKAGLVTVYGIIHEHQGTIEVDSTPQKGATFRIKLPKNPAEARKGATE